MENLNAALEQVVPHIECRIREAQNMGDGPGYLCGWADALTAVLALQGHQSVEELRERLMPPR